MKVFKLKADCEFEAKDIDDSFERLASHFKGLKKDGFQDDGFFIKGKIEIKKIDKGARK